VRYETATAFRMALEQRMKTEAERTGFNLARLRKRVAFELFLRRLAQVAPDRWVLKGALALDFRLGGASRSTKDIDLGRDDDEEAAIEDIAAAQRLRLDDFFTFTATRTDAFDEVDEFQAIRFHVRAELAERVFEQFIVDIGFAKAATLDPDRVRTSDFLSFAGIEPPRASRDTACPAPGREGPRIHAELWHGGQAQHAAQGPDRHPAHCGLSVVRSRRVARGAEAHLREPRPPSASQKPARPTVRVDTGLWPPRRGGWSRARPGSGIRSRRRLPRSCALG